MLELKTKKELAKEAYLLARGHELVRYRSVSYIPADFETRDVTVVPDRDRTIWLPLTRQRIQQMAAAEFDTLFGSDGELGAFDFMVAQSAFQVEHAISSLLVRTEQGLRELNGKGELVDATGDFRPNALLPVLYDDQPEKDRVFGVIAEWLDSEDEAHSLLRHLATSLAPGWSAVKYVLLLGEGRNGKSLLLKMLTGLFGRDNISNVTRQAISAESAVVTELNGKLLNIVYDGRAEYVKDSGTEKSLVAGEAVSIRKLYESTATVVQTNALFIEGLNREPKTHDKSTALQKRLVRFQFPKVYELSHAFERLMLTPESLGAFMSLLIEHYVREDEVAGELALTTKAIELQLEQMYSNSLGLQFIRFVDDTNPLGVEGLLGESMHDIVKQYQSWRLKENDLGTWGEPEVMAQLLPLVNTERRSVRTAGSVRKVRVVTSLKTEATQFIESLKGDDADDAAILAVVED